MKITEFYLEDCVENGIVEEDDNYVELDYKKQTAIATCCKIDWDKIADFTAKLKKAGAADEVTVYSPLMGFKAKLHQALTARTKVYYAGPDGKAIEVR